MASTNPQRWARVPPGLAWNLFRVQDQLYGKALRRIEERRDPPEP